MTYKGFKYHIDWTWLVIFPTIIILKDEPQYFDKNFAIQIHWLGFHLRWFWIKEFKSENFVGVETFSDYSARKTVLLKNLKS